MKFLFHFYNIDERAGIQRAICELANALVGAGNEVVLATNTAPSAVAFRLDTRVVLEQIINPEVRQSGLGAWPLKVRWASRQMRILKALVRQHKPSLVVDHGTALGLIYPFRSLGGAPFLLQRHFPVKAFPNGEVLYRILSYISGNRPIVLLTQSIASEMRAVGFKNVHVIPNVVPEDARKCAYAEAIPRTGLLMGRAKNPQKGFDLFLRALATIKTDGWNFSIVGPGVDTDPLLLDIVRTHHLENRVTLRPSSDDPYELIRKSCCLIMPSRYEALPMVAIEALAIGRPLLASNVDGLRELIKHEINGLQFENESVPALAACLERMCSNSSELEEFAQHSHESLDEYWPDRVIRQWMDLAASLSSTR